MSILDKIKKLFCSNSCKTSETAKNDKVDSDSVSKPQSEPEVKEVKSESKPQSAPEAKQEPAQKPSNVVKKESTPAAPKIKATKLSIPEDSALRRHFLSNLRAEIEEKMPPRPTEAAKRSQHDAAVQAELDKLVKS